MAMRAWLLPRQGVARIVQPLLQRPLTPCVMARPMASAAAAKKKAKKGKQAAGSGPATMPPMTPKFDPQSDAPIDDYRREGKRTPQQLLVEQVVAKNYSRLKMTENKRRHADLNRRIKLRQAAIAALPEALQAEAKERDMEEFPVWRQPAGEEIVITFAEQPAAQTDADAEAEAEE